MINWLKKNIYVVLLLLVSAFLFTVNYKSGTWLIGWDNVFPEFNFGLNIKRDLLAIWQQYRGLGLVDGMSHASLIVQDFVRLFLSLFLPTTLIRWVYILGLHFVGGLGMMKLLNNILGRDKNGNGSGQTQAISFLGALFYMFNLGSIIQFFLPLEVFIVHFAILPWIALFTLSYLNQGRRKDLVLLGIFSFLATPQAHVPTVFIAYAIAMFIILAVSVFQLKFKNIKKIFIIAALLFATNAFWFLPFTITNISNSKVVSNTKPFQMASNDIFYRNNKYGDFADVALIKGLPLEFSHLDYKNNLTHLMMWPWVDHLKTPFFYIPSWLFFFLAVLGLIYSIKSKNKNYLPFAAVFIFSFFMLGSDIPIINVLSQFLRKYVPFFNIIFRFTFTKFSIIYAFSYSVLMIVGLKVIIDQLRKMLKDKITNLLIIFCFMLIFSYSFPAFQGHFFYENLTVKIPNEYFQVFDFFKSQNKDERIAELPIPWYWTWLQPRWGTINSGFIWHGIEQPIMDLAFMPWGSENENYYWELDQAIYSKNPDLLKKVLEKYDISWVYLDKNNLTTQGGKITYGDYEEILSQTDGVKLSKTFGLIQIYSFKNQNNLSNFISIKSNLKNVGPSYNYDNFDSAYSDGGDYYSKGLSLEIYYPFRSLFSGKSPADQEYQVQEDEKYIIFRSALSVEARGKRLDLSSFSLEEFSQYLDDGKIIKLIPQIFIDNMLIPVDFEKDKEIILPNFKKGILSIIIEKNKILKYASNKDQFFLDQVNDGCDKNDLTTSLVRFDDGFRMSSVGSHNCIKINLPNLTLRNGYLLDIKTKNDDKRGFLVNMFDSTVEKSNLETYLDNDGKIHDYHFIISPRNYYGLGYTLYFDNLSEGREKVVNDLYNVNIYQIPYYFLKELKIIYGNKNNNNRIYYLSQSYHPGWIAIANGKILTHVKVNNWANGWELTDKKITKVTIIFWPQYLEFLGLGLLIVAIIFILKTRS